MKLLVDSNVVAAAAAGNELAQAALDQSGAAMTGTPEMTAIAVDVANELFEEFTAEYAEDRDESHLPHGIPALDRAVVQRSA